MFRILPFVAVVILLSPGIQVTDTSGDQFVQLESSPLFGAGGTVLDMTERITAPFPLDTIPTAGWTEDTFYKDETDCSTITFANVTARMNADKKVVWFPKCTITVSKDIDSSGQSYTMTGDERIFRGTPGLSKIRVTQSSETNNSATEWNYTEGEIARAKFLGKLFQIGNSGSLTPVVPDCALDTMPDIGDRTLDLTNTGNCNVTTGNWGNGDIVRIQQAQIPDAGTNDPMFAFRVTCRNGPNAGTGDQSGSDCTMNPPENGLGLSDPIPMDLSWNQYFFNGETGDSSATVDLMERIGSLRSWNGVNGVGTETNNVNELLGFTGIDISRDNPGAYDAGSSTSAFLLLNVFDFELSDSKIHHWGGSSIFGGSGGNGLEFVGRVNLFGNHFDGPAYAGKCLAEVTNINTATNPVRITAQGTAGAHAGVCDNMDNAGADVNPANGVPDDNEQDFQLYFSQDAPSANIADTYSARPTTYITNPGGSPVTAVFELRGVNGAGWDTTTGGFVTVLDDYSSAVIYFKNGVDNIQIVNNSVINPRVFLIVQDGASRVVTAANYIRHDQNMHFSRGEFPHGNSSAPGLHFELNDTDAGPIMLASSNGGTARVGDGLHRVVYKNRMIYTGPSTFPSAGTPYADQVTRGTVANNEDDDQLGTSNEEWSLFGNLMYDMPGSVDLDDVANNGGGGASVAPHLTYELSFHRNRCYFASCDFDGDFDTTPTTNTTTRNDVTGGAAQANYEDDEISALLLSEQGNEPTSIFFRSVPAWWDDVGSPVPFGEIGAWYDDVSGGVGGLAKLPAQLRCEADGDC